MPATLPALKMAVVGHVEWVRFACVREVPKAGEIAHSSGSFEEPAGGGAVAAVQLARLAGSAELLTALGEDQLATETEVRMASLGVSVSAAPRERPTRTAFTLLDSHGERTITTIGERLEPAAADPGLPWERLAAMDGVYFTAGDERALRIARAAGVLVATPRAGEALKGDVTLDALVLSGRDERELDRARDVSDKAKLLVLTEGESGGTYKTADGRSGSWAAIEPPGSIADSYGSGDSFAAGLTYGLALGLSIDRALTIAACCGAVCLTGHGPYQRQLTADRLAEMLPQSVAWESS